MRGRREISRNHKVRRVNDRAIRKFFRTQLAALGVQTDYIEHMMGHTISTYHDIQMKGINTYAEYTQHPDQASNQKRESAKSMRSKKSSAPED
jgi:intergrase/recombinase